MKARNRNQQPVTKHLTTILNLEPFSEKLTLPSTAGNFLGALWNQVLHKVVLCSCPVVTNSCKATRLRCRLIRVAYVTRLGCLCLIPSALAILDVNMIVSMYITAFASISSIGLSKSRPFCWLSIDSERKLCKHTTIVMAT